MPTITVSDENKKYIEKLRKDMPFVDNKVPNVKKTIELILQFIGESESEFMQWIEKRKEQES